MQEALTEALTELGGDSNYVELAKLKAHAKVRSYFRRAFFRPPWEDDTFAMFFQSRPAEWDFDEATRGVRVLSDVAKQIAKVVSNKRRTAPFPEALYTQVLKAGTAQETVQVVSNSAGTELAALPIDSIEALMDTLGKPIQADNPQVAAILAVAHLNAQIKVLAAVPGALAKKLAALGQVMEFYRLVIAFGGDTPDPKVAEQKIKTLKELCADAATLIREKGVGTVSPKVLMLLCSTAPFHISALAIAGLGDKGDGEDVKACAGLLGKVPAHVLEGLAQETMLQLAVASTKSTAVSEATLGMVAKACAATLPSWSMDDVAKLLLALSKAKGAAESAEVKEVYGRAAEALAPKLAEMSVTQLIKVALVLGKVPSCKEFLEMLAADAAGRAAGMPSPQLLLLTQGLLPLGAANDSVSKVLEAWVASAADAKLTLSADHLAKLAQLVAPAVPGHEAFWKMLGGKLAAEQKALTDAGWASLEAAFPADAASGPAFEEKEALLAAAKARKQPKEEEKKRDSRGKDDKKRSRSREDRRNGGGGGGGGKSRSRSRRGGGGGGGGRGGRSRSRDRRRSRSRDRDRRRR